MIWWRSTPAQVIPDLQPMSNNATTITFANSDTEIDDCYDVMSELRPHIAREDFLPRVRRQMETFDYRLAYLFDGEVKTVAGIRISEWLHGGKYLEIDDLVSKSGERSKGYGGRLFDWIAEFARAENCDHVRLLSGVQRFEAHRFYLAKRMNIEAHYFTLKL
jgi:GNAT superfamily N-acetyltransferase